MKYKGGGRGNPLMQANFSDVPQEKSVKILPVDVYRQCLLFLSIVLDKKSKQVLVYMGKLLKTI